jgi:hypothetical protein
VHEQPAGAERRNIAFDLHLVESDCGLDALRRDRQRARLIGRAHRDHVGHHVVAEQVLGERARIEHQASPTIAYAENRLHDGIGGHFQVYVADHLRIRQH